MQWRRQRRVTHVIGSSNHVLLLARYQDVSPDEEDEEEGLRKDYARGRENDTSRDRFDRNGRGGYKPRRAGNGDSSSYAGAANRSHKDVSSGSPSQPKMIFNEDEYMRITTPRQDMLLKKGYLSRKKPWTGNASTSATPSTTESQSASHSTAGRDGSETTEDQQLLDRDCGTGEYPSTADSGLQLGYGTFYDHACGYYYEYPVMLVGPAPVPAQVGPGVLAAVPCEPVPLRPIEWVNPAFVPSLSGQPYLMVDYQSSQSTENATMVEEQETTVVPVETVNGTCNENGTESASCSGSVTGETEEQPAEAAATTKESEPDEQPTKEQAEEQDTYEQFAEEQPEESETNGAPYMEPVLVQQPVHVSHVIPVVPQQYMYPGHYMFGLPLVNVNGVTLQGGPMMRSTDFADMSTACNKRRKKKKRGKQRRLAVDNTEDEEEGECSSECDTELPSSRLSWTGGPTPTTNATAASNKPLNPDCKEFQLRPVELNAPLSVKPTSADKPAPEEVTAADPSGPLTSVDKNSNPCNGVVEDGPKSLVDDSNSDEAGGSPSETSQAASPEVTQQDNEANRLTNCLAKDAEAALANELVEVIEIETPSSVDASKPASDSSSANEPPRDEVNGVEEGTLVNGKMDTDSSNEDAQTPVALSRPSSPSSDRKTRSRSATPSTVPTETMDVREEYQETLATAKPSNSVPKRKYSAKGTKFVREPTPGPDLDSATELETEKMPVHLTHSLESMNLSNDSKPDSTFDRCGKDEDEVAEDLATESVCNHLSKEDPIEASNEDSGFESQTRLSDYPITEAVTEWLRRANSPDVFITSAVSVEGDVTEDEDAVDEKPSKNLQGNPMPALSANSGADDAAALSRTASCGEFARVSNVKGQDQPEAGNCGGGRKKRDGKRRSGDRWRARHGDGKLESEAVSSSDSCGQQEQPVTAARKKNPSKQQDAGDVCEFTEKDSVAGVRVASSSRMDSKRVNARRTKRQGRSSREPANNDTKNRCTENDKQEEGKGGAEDTMNVRTFEKGEIVVSEDGKLLTTTTYEPDLPGSLDDPFTAIKAASKNETAKKVADKVEGSKTKSTSGDEGNGSEEISLDSMEEPDVLECWEAETIEPVITPKKMLQCQGVSCEGEAAEEDNNEAEKVNLDYVQEYYRLARESAASSVEEETSGSKTNVEMSASKSVPNNPEETKEVRRQNGDKSDIPIDEAFEVYESCYTGKPPFLAIDSKVFKSRTLYGQEGEHPIPCRGVCCNIQ
ncbi:uncharacterized protein LOC143375891 isoform X4 [Andrena cerasifolii]|uniref:uncharacterized protein LOC143375891 isoform X4 n=1 Tax=Andrena cerasifolii TaxID=2819439 RepID=UPI004037CA28